MFFCQDCQREVPTALAHNADRCIPCARLKCRLYRRKNIKEMSEAERLELRTKNAALKRNEPVEWKRCYDAWKKISYRCPKHIPKWVSMESLLPIYCKAAQMDRDEPDYWHIVCHLIPLRMVKEVCGLHALSNLIIKRSKKLSGKGISHRILRSQYHHFLGDQISARNKPTS